MRNDFTIPRYSVKRLMEEFTQYQIADQAITEMTRTLELIVKETVDMANVLVRLQNRKRITPMDILMSEKRLKDRLDRII